MVFLWRSAFVVALGTVTWLSLAPADRLPPIGLWDKLSHAIAFAALAALIHAGWPRTPQPALWGVLVGYGLVLEILQLLSPGRTFSWLDLLADAAGVAAYAAATRLTSARRPLGRAN